MADVFLSYARADEAVARRVAKGLEAAGLRVWWDADLPAHRSYSDVIQRNLEEAPAVVVLWSKGSASSQWVRAEADFARNSDKLVQAQIDATLPPIPFNQIQCADLKGWRGGGSHRGWAKLCSSVKALVTGEDQPRAEIAEERWWERPRTRWSAIAAALLLLIAAGLLVFRGELFGAGDSERPIVAVLPFESLDQRDASLVSGIWEDTRQALSRNPQLLVLGPNTSEHLGGDPKAANRAADYLVEASVRSAGDRVRVTANLVRTDDGAQMWSESFDRRLDDIFELQQQIAGEIEGRIRGRLAKRGGTLPEHIATSGEVYALYADARAKIRNRHMDKYKEAYEQLREVVRRDPNFAPGWATLAVVKGFEILGRQSSRSEAEADARRAISLAPNLAAGYAALGLALGREGPAAKAALERALELDPNDIEAMNWLANALSQEGNDDATLKLYDRILEIEPLWWSAIFNKMNLLKRTGSIDALNRELLRLEKIGEERLATVVKIVIAEERGDLSSAAGIGLDYYRRASPEDRPFVGNFLVGPLFRLGLTDIADQLSKPPNDYIPFIRANNPRAIEMIETQHPPEAFWTYGHLAIVGARVYLLNGQGPRLARQYQAVASSPEEFEMVVGKHRFPDIAPGAALALRSVGDEKQARRLLELAEQRAPSVRAMPLDQQIRLARIYAVQGRTDEAIGELSSAVRRGWLPPWLPIHTDIALDPPLNELRKDPRFEQIRQQILGHIAKERAELGPVKLN